jgi:hypothetical protein
MGKGADTRLWVSTRKGASRSAAGAGSDTSTPKPNKAMPSGPRIASGRYIPGGRLGGQGRIERGYLVGRPMSFCPRW